MTLTPREKLIAAGVGVTLLLLLGGTYVVAPYFSERQQLNTAIEKADAQAKNDKQLLENQPRVTAEWAKITASALKTQAAQAAGEVNDALFDWARTARFKLQALKPDRAVQKGDFQQIRFQVAGEGPSQNVASFLLALETTDLPVQIDELRVNSRKEGINDLTVQLTVSTLFFSPPPTTKPGVRTPAPKGDSE